MLLLKAWPIYNKARARPVRTTRGDAENSGPNSGTERRRTSFPIASWPGTVIPRSLLTANIRLKRNSRYLTQAMPPDTIFVTLTVCFVDHWIVRHATSARERIGIRYALLAVTRGSGKRCSCFLFFSYSFRFWLASLLSLSLFVSLSLFWLSSVYVNDPNSTVCSRVDCSSSNAPDNVFLLLRGIHSRCARSRPGPTIIAEAWQGFSFFRDEKDLKK